MQPEEMLALVQKGWDMNFRAFKIRMDWKGWRQDADPEKDYQMFKLVREFLSDGNYLGFDANNGYSVSTAIQQGRRFEELGIDHFEEPIPNWNLTFGTRKEDIDIHALTVNAKLFLLTGRIQPFVQVGLGASIAAGPGQSNDFAFAGRFGGGLAYMVSENLAVSVSALHTRTRSDLNLQVGSGQSTPAVIVDLNYTQLTWAVGYHFF